MCLVNTIIAKKIKLAMVFCEIAGWIVRNDTFPQKMTKHTKTYIKTTEFYICLDIQSPVRHTVIIIKKRYN